MRTSMLPIQSKILKIDSPRNVAVEQFLVSKCYLIQAYQNCQARAADRIFDSVEFRASRQRTQSALWKSAMRQV